MRAWLGGMIAVVVASSGLFTPPHVSATPRPVAVAAAAWTSVPPAATRDRNTVFDSVSERSSRFAMMVGAAGVTSGSRSLKPVAETFNGWSWTRRHPRNRAGGVYLEAVSCPSRQDCTAVGITAGSRPEEPVAEQWNGFRWRMEPIPGSSALPTVLQSLSCPTVQVCYAVGARNDSPTPTGTVSVTNSVAVSDVWHPGAGWKAVPVPALMATKASDLAAVSCSSSGRCMAVGARHVRSGLVDLGYRWTGKGWAPTMVPHAVTRFTLTAVSCSSPGNCAILAVNPRSGDPTTVMLRHGQYQVRAPIHTGHQMALTSVSCATNTACYLAGFETKAVSGSFVAVPVTERWNGQRWDLLETPAPGGAAGAGLQSISCASADTCITIGDTDPGRPIALSRRAAAQP